MEITLEYGDLRMTAVVFDLFWGEYATSRQLHSKVEMGRAEHWRPGDYWEPSLEWIWEWRESRKARNEEKLIRYFLCGKHRVTNLSEGRNHRQYVGPWAVIRFQALPDDRQKICLDIKSLGSGETLILSAQPTLSEQELEGIFQAFIAYLRDEGYLETGEPAPIQDAETSADKVDRPKLRQILAERFNEGELKNLCFDLDIEYGGLSGEGIGDKARELVSYCQRHERIPELIKRGEELRSDVEWSKVYE